MDYFQKKISANEFRFRAIKCLHHVTRSGKEASEFVYLIHRLKNRQDGSLTFLAKERQDGSLALELKNRQDGSAMQLFGQRAVKK